MGTSGITYKDFFSYIFGGFSPQKGYRNLFFSLFDDKEFSFFPFINNKKSNDRQAIHRAYTGKQFRTPIREWFLGDVEFIKKYKGTDKSIGNYFSFELAYNRFKHLCETGFNEKKSTISYTLFLNRSKEFILNASCLKTEMRNFLLLPEIDLYMRLVYLMIFCAIGNEIYSVDYDIPGRLLPGSILYSSNDGRASQEKIKISLNTIFDNLDQAVFFAPDYKNALQAFVFVANQTRTDFKKMRRGVLTEEYKKECPMSRTTFFSLLNLHSELLNQLINADSIEALKDVILKSKDQVLVSLFERYLYFDELKKIKGKTLFQIRIRSEYMEKVFKLYSAHFCDPSAQQFHTLQLLNQSYLSKDVYFHNAYWSIPKLEINITLSQYINHICLDGFTRSDANRLFVQRIIDELIGSHNHDTDYMCLLVEKYKDKPILSDSATDEIAGRIFKIFEDINSTDQAYIPAFSSRAAAWARENHQIVFLQKLIVNGHVFDHHLWNEYFSVSRASIAIVRAYILSILNEPQITNKNLGVIQFTKMAGFLDEVTMLRIYSSAPNEFQKAFEKFISRMMRIDTRNPQNNHNIARGCTKMLNVIPIEKAVQILKAYFSTYPTHDRHYDILYKRLTQDAFSSSIAEESSTLTRAEQFEHMANAYLGGDGNYAFLAEIMVHMRRKDIPTEELKELYNKTFSRLVEDKVDIASCQKLICVNRVMLNDDGLQSYSMLLDEFSKHIETEGIEPFEINVLIEIGRRKSRDTRHEYYSLLFYHALDQLEKAQNKDKIDCTKLFHQSICHLGYANTAKLFIDEQNVDLHEMIYTKKLCRVLKPGYISYLAYPFFQPFISFLARSYNYEQLNELMQINLLHYMKRKKQFDPQMFSLIKKYVSDKAGWDKLSLPMKAAFISCIDDYDVKYESYKHVADFIDQEVLVNIAHNRYIKVNYHYYSPEDFRYHVIKFLKNYPEKTAYLCAILLGRILTCLSHACMAFARDNNIGNSLDQLRKYRILDVVVANPCIRLFSYYIAGKMQALLSPPHITADFAAQMRDSDFPIDSIVKIREERYYPAWFNKQYPGLSEDELTAVKNRCISVHIDDIYAVEDVEPKVYASLVCAEDITAFPKNQPYDDYRWDLAVVHDASPNKYRLIQGRGYYDSLIQLNKSSLFSPIVDNVMVFLFDVGEVPSESVDCQVDNKPSHMQFDVKIKTEDILQENYDLLEKYFCTQLSARFKRNKLYKSSLVKSYDRLFSFREKKYYQEKLPNLLSVLKFFDEFYFWRKSDQKLPTDNIYMYERILSEIQPIISTMDSNNNNAG